MISKAISSICLDNDDYAQPLHFYLIHKYLYMQTTTKRGKSTTIFKTTIEDNQKILHGQMINGELTRFALAKNRSAHLTNLKLHNNKLLINTPKWINEDLIITMTEINEEQLPLFNTFDFEHLINVPMNLIQEWRKLSNIDFRTKIKEITLWDYYAHTKKVNAEHIYDHSLSQLDIQNLAGQYPLTLNRIFLDYISNQRPKIQSFYTDFHSEIIANTTAYTTHLTFRCPMDLQPKHFKHYQKLQTFYAPFQNPIHSSMMTMDYSFIIHKNQVYLQDILIGTLKEHFPHTIITRFYSRNIPCLHKQQKTKHHEPNILITPYILYYTPTQVKVHIVINTPEQLHNCPYNLYKTVNTKLFHEDTFKDFSYQELKYQDLYRLLDSR